MTTQEIIKTLRDIIAGHRTIDGIPTDELTVAADRLEQLQRELKQAIIERTPHDYGLLKKEATFLQKERDEALAEVKRLKMDLRILNETARNEQLVAARPEPSRLEIAVMLKAGWFANRDADFNARDHKWWIEQADAFVAAAKEGK
jgi:hypothetical protein